MNLSLILLLIGILGFVLNKKNKILVLILIEIMLYSATFLFFPAYLFLNEIFSRKNIIASKISTWQLTRLYIIYFSFLAKNLFACTIYNLVEVGFMIYLASFWLKSVGADTVYLGLFALGLIIYLA